MGAFRPVWNFCRSWSGAAPALALLVSSAGAEAVVADEESLKAAFLYNFSRFVEWPPESFTGVEEPLVVGIFGPGGVGPVLEEIVGGQTAEGRPMAVHYLDRLEEVSRCHLLFVSRYADVTIGEVLAAAAGAPVLTVSDAPGFASAGGMVGFVVEENKMRLEVNPPAVRANGLRVRSRLLRLASIVDGETG